MRSLIRISHFYSNFVTIPLPQSSSIRCKFSCSADSHKAKLYKQCNEFLPWLQRKTGCEISPVLSVGFSSYGWSLFASKPIRAGDCILKIPYSAHITADKFQREIDSLIVDDVDIVSRLAVVLLAEKKRGHDSEWAPYVQSLPRINEMHNTMFWNKEELGMLRACSIYQDILDQKSHLEKEFLALEPVLDHFPQTFGVFTLENFMHAYALIISRAWRTSRGPFLIPFADFINHDGGSEGVLLSDDTKEASEVITGRDYATGEQVNIWMEIPKHDPLYTLKLELIRRHCFPLNRDANSLKFSGSSFIIREVKSPRGKGKGIPLALRAYDLNKLQIEAADNDGRLARHSLSNMESEIHAHHILLSELTRKILDHEAYVKDLESVDSSDTNGPVAMRKKMVTDLLNGEIRVLKSACAWLTNYCANVSASTVG